VGRRVVGVTARQLKAKAKKLGVRLPHRTTLRRYGLTEYAWLKRLDEQGWVCPLCLRLPLGGKFVVDHEHVRGWKDMPDEERATYVRGLLCWQDNKFLLPRSFTIEVADRVVQYLRDYLARRA